MTKNYVGIYETHVDNQFKALDDEIKSLVDNLHALKDKVKHYFSDELYDLRIKGEEVRERINKFLDENPDLETPKLSSAYEIHEHLNRIANVEDLHDFMKQLYFRSMETFDVSEKAPDCKVTLKLMEEIQHKVASMQDAEIDFTRIRGKILLLLL